MTTILESTAFLKQRAGEIGMSEKAIEALEKFGVKKLSTLAFAHGQPNQPIKPDEFVEFHKKINGGTEMAVADAAALKQLLFESHVLVTQQLKARLEEPSAESSVPKQLPIAEKTARMTKLKQELRGVLVEGSLEPSNSLLELMCHMVNTKVLKYVEPSKCTSREWEISNARPKKLLQIDGANLSVKDSISVTENEPHGLHEHLNAFRRRGLAFHFADLMSWEIHEKYLATLMDRMSLDPPPGYARTSLNQILRADRQCFTKAMREVTDFVRTPAGDLPLDAFFVDVLQHSEIAFHLLPMPAKGKGKGEKGKQDWGNQWRSQPYTTGKGKGKQDPKGKGKGTGLWKMPAALKEHGSPVDDQNEPICYGYNLGTCTAAVAAGGKCDKGRHVCCFKQCYKLHTYLEHNKQSKQ